ncbi:hypothetical protein J6590_105742 [Homalodisca vitripennis]|nr:hypothetical protein J6590_105742 [Homalodisca vitripennis]
MTPQAHNYPHSCTTRYIMYMLMRCYPQYSQLYPLKKFTQSSLKRVKKNKGEAAFITKLLFPVLDQWRRRHLLVTMEGDAARMSAGDAVPPRLDFRRPKRRNLSLELTGGITMAVLQFTSHCMKTVSTRHESVVT